ALTTSRMYVKISGTIHDAVLVSGGQVVTFLGDPNSELTQNQNSGGGTITIQGNKTALSVDELSISDGANPGGNCCFLPSGSPALMLTRVTISNNPGGGITVATGGTLNVSQSTVSGNAGGGITVVDSGTMLQLMVSQSTVSGNASGGISVMGSAVILDIE